MPKESIVIGDLKVTLNFDSKGNVGPELDLINPRACYDERVDIGKAIEIQMIIEKFLNENEKYRKKLRLR